MYTYHGHTDKVSSASWSPDGKLIVSGSWDKTVQVWDATTGAVAWSHNGKRIAAVTQVYCGDLCGVVLSWDAYTEHNFTFYVDVPVFALAWSPDDTRLVTAIVVSTQGLPQGNSSKEVDGQFVQISEA